MEENRRELVQIANEYVTQDNLMTAHPIGYVVTDVELELTENDEDVILCMHEGEYLEFENQEEAEKYIKENFFSEEDRNAEVTYIDQYFDDVVSMQKVRRVSEKAPPLFLTKSSIDNYIENNKHHHREAKSYLVSLANKNAQTRLLLEQLYHLADVPKEKWNPEALRYYETILKRG